MKRLTLFISVACLSLLGACAMGGREDAVTRLCRASDRGDTRLFNQGVDSLESVAVDHARAYAELALVFRHRWRQHEASSQEADREALRMCIYHRMGLMADSAEMRAAYEAYRKGTYAAMERVAGREQLLAIIERMMERMDTYLQDFIAKARLSAYQLVAELEMQFPGLVRNMERVLDDVIQSIHNAVNETLDSIYQ